ncbi:MAG: hypothetical protein E1N59_2257 [Puniceicoccaceae bacterium 5H]|nr:MAG: hypothetical protein E1N59_2257 [Puniceicoccaceae bacterium 5H]
MKTIGQHFRSLRLVLLGALALTGATLVQAQGWGPDEGRLTPEERLERMVDHLSVRLELTDEQQTEVEKILTQSFDRQKAFLDQAREATSESEARKLIKQSHDVRKETQDQIMDLLDKGQRKEYKKMLKRMEKARGRFGSRGGPGGPPPEGGPGGPGGPPPDDDF